MKRSFLNSTRPAALLIPLLLGLFLCAATRVYASGQAAQAPKHDRDHPVWLRIMAFTDAPVVGADVRITLGGPHGPVLADAKAATNNHGVFPARIWRRWLLDEEATADKKTPERDRRCRQSFVRISISGGTINGNPFLEHLSADISVTDPEHQILVVNPVTTLVSRLLDARPKLKLDRAETLVRRFLKLPENYSLGLALRQSSHYVSPFFSPVVFLKEAQEAGGLDAFLHLLLQELASPPADHPFRPPQLLGSRGRSDTARSQLLGSTGSSDASSVMQAGLYAGLLDVASAEGVESLAGWALSLTGLFPTSDTTQDDIDALTNALSDLQSSIENLSNQVNALTDLVQSTATQTQYNTIVVPAQALAAQVNGVENDLAYWANACPPYYVGQTTTNPEPYCSSEKVSVNAELNNVAIQQAYGSMESYVEDNPTIGFRGMLHLYSLWLAQSKPFFRPADSTYMQNLYDYWNAALTQAANLKIELLHENDAQDGNPQELTDFMGNPEANPPTTNGTFQIDQTANLALMKPAVPEGTVIDTRSRLMWATDYPMMIPVDGGFGGCPSQYNPPFNFPGYGWELGPSSGMSFAGFSGWTSPTLSVMQGLINGWSGTKPMSWLIDQSNAVTPDMPTSSGFFDVTGCPGGGWIWTTTQPANSSPGSFEVVSMFSGQVSTVRTYPNGGLEWQMIMRPLAQGEQYFFYQ